MSPVYQVPEIDSSDSEHSPAQGVSDEDLTRNWLGWVQQSLPDPQQQQQQQEEPELRSPSLEFLSADDGSSEAQEERETSPISEGQEAREPTLADESQERGNTMEGVEQNETHALQAQVAALHAEIERSRAAAAAEQARMAAAMEEMRAAFAAITTQQAPTQNQAPAPAPTPSSGRRRQALPAVLPFHGDRELYRTWRLAMDNKLLVDGDAIGGPDAQVAYVYNSLQGVAATQCLFFVQELLKETPVQLLKLMDHLDALYKDPDTDMRVMKELGTPQGKMAFPQFLPIFEGRLARAGGTAWPDKSKVFALQSVISPQLQTLVSLVGTSMTDYKVYREAALQMSQNSGAMSMVIKNQGGVAAVGFGTGFAGSGQNVATPEPMDWTTGFSTQLATQPAARGGGGNNRGRGGRGGGQGTGARPNAQAYPSDDQLRGIQARWVSPDEIARRRSAGLCMRCARPGCSTRHCPMAPAINPQRAHQRVSDQALRAHLAAVGVTDGDEEVGGGAPLLLTAGAAQEGSEN